MHSATFCHVLSCTVLYCLVLSCTALYSGAIVEIEKPKSEQVHHSWVRILALIPYLVAAANLLSVQLSIQLSISLSIQL